MRYAATFLTLSWATGLGSLLAVGCDSGGETAATSERQYEAHCEVNLEPTAEAPSWEALGRGNDQAEAESAAWAQLCPQAGLPEGCAETLPDGVRRSGWSCTSLGVTGGSIEAAENPMNHTCRISLTDERTVLRLEHRAAMVGSAEDTEESDPLCQQAIEAACAEAGLEGDCTAGDDPAYRLAGRSAGRQLQN